MNQEWRFGLSLLNKSNISNKYHNLISSYFHHLSRGHMQYLEPEVGQHLKFVFVSVHKHTKIFHLFYIVMCSLLYRRLKVDSTKTDDGKLGF